MPDQIEKADVCFVSMPYAAFQRPSMGLGLLQAILARDGISAVVAYANLWFAEQVGPNPYNMLAQAPTTFLMGEWTFAHAAFGASAERDERYLSLLFDAGHRFPHSEGKIDRLVATVRALRKAATRFADEAARRVLATGARVVGCTSTFEQQVASLALLRRIHELDPSVITMLGGANCETDMGEATHRCFPWVDYVVSGEADGLITDLCRLALTRGRDVTAGDLADGVLGPCHRAGQAQPAPPGKLSRAMFHDLDSLPVPRFDDYFRTLERSPLRKVIRPGIPLETSRGCWWGAKHHCTFCGLNGSSLTFRSKSPDRVLGELDALEERYGISDFMIVDDILDMRYFTTLLPQLAEDPRSRQIFYEVKSNLSRRQVELLVRAGVTWVQPGIESLHSDVLRLMDKGVQGWQNVRLLKWARELGLRLSWSLLWGFPGERDECYRQMAGWLPLLEHLQPPAGLVRLRYDRYSVYHERAGQLGLVLFPIPAMSYIYPVEPADIGRLAYFFVTEPGRDRLDVGDLQAAVMGTGVRAAQEAALRWRRAFLSESPPILSMTDSGGALNIVDTRECAPAPRRTLAGLARAVLLACDDALRVEKLSEILNRDYGLHPSSEEIAATVEGLIADRLVLRIDDRVIGLAVKDGLSVSPREGAFPGGQIRRLLPLAR